MKNKSLHNINKTGFKTPQDYFNNFDDSLLSVAKLKDNASAPGFKIPDNYFKTLEVAVTEKISSEKKPKVIPLFNKRNILYATSIAAAVVLLFSLTLFNNEKNSWNTLDIETVENYILDEELTSYDMATLLVEDNLEIENFVNHNFEEDNIESYLLDHIDVEDFIEE
ncbi:hypothetical protein [Neotamlana sedimentorum]|uniref:hypothetical protein n=1 Tax=Neotamlana sedimentorum TaxID=1435349 RepID=UPI000699B3C5|nr:hypothetical protein [Tamlana sedimentorum]